MIDSTCEDKLYRTSKFADAVRYNVPTNLRDTGMSRLRGFNRMCSSKLSVNCEKAEKDTLR